MLSSVVLTRRMVASTEEKPQGRRIRPGKRHFLHLHRATGAITLIVVPLRQANPWSGGGHAPDRHPTTVPSRAGRSCIPKAFGLVRQQGAAFYVETRALWVGLDTACPSRRYTCVSRPWYHTRKNVEL